MALPHYLTRGDSGRYLFRIRVPADLRGTVGRDFIKPAPNARTALTRRSSHFRSMPAATGVANRAVDVALRVAWVSRFIQTADLHPGASGILTPFKDTRMWIAAFKPDGNRDGN